MDLILVEFFGGQEDILMFVLFFKKSLIVIDLARERHSADNLDLSALIDEDIGGMHVADLLFQVFEFTASSDDIVQQVPYLSF